MAFLNNPMAALAAVNRVSGLPTGGSRTGAALLSGPIASAHSKGTANPLELMTCKQLCDDISFHAANIEAATNTMQYEIPYSPVWLELMDLLRDDMAALQEVTSECSEKHCRCCGGGQDDQGIV